LVTAPRDQEMNGEANHHKDGNASVDHSLSHFLELSMDLLFLLRRFQRSVRMDGPGD
jgi:hypothetical protein